MRLPFALFALLFLCGLGVLILPAFEVARGIAAWSDLMHFAATVEADPAARHVLQRGGERPNEDFYAWAKRVTIQKPGKEAKALGTVIIILSVAGMTACFWKRKKL